MISYATYDLDFKKLQAKFKGSTINLEQYLESLTKLMIGLKKYVLYPLQLNTNIETLNLSNRALKLYKVIKDEIKRYS